jgi:caffeoyl-CoA O-methyltransferase
MSQAVKIPSPRPVTPLTILAFELKIILEMLNKESVSPELTAKLNQAYQMAAGLDPYLEESTTQESPALANLAIKTASVAWDDRFHDGVTVRHLEQEMLSGHVEGQTLKMFVRMIQAKRVLEIGMFTGYSALAMAEALPEDGCLVACEVDPHAAEIAQLAFAESPHGSKIRIELGSALETLHKLAAAGESFDFVFIDADKQEYVAYFQTLLDSNLLTPCSYICIDNTLFQGQVYLPQSQRTPNGQAIANFNSVVAADKRVEQVLLPLRDGLTLIRKC